jgi:LmbE family N-acetylglucosaminyl deacetylase
VSRVLVLSPHPDDEAIGCGGTLAKHVAEGDRVRIVFITSGEAGGHGRTEEETRRVREAEATAAGAILGVEAVEFWREPDGRVRATRGLARRLRDQFETWRPDLVYVTHAAESHRDHRAVERTVRHVVSREIDPALRPAVRMFEVWTALQRLDHVVDITAYVERKVAAIRAHGSQCDVMSFDEASLALARWRGEMFSWPVGDYAEVFEEMRL